MSTLGSSGGGCNWEELSIGGEADSAGMPGSCSAGIEERSEVSDPLINGLIAAEAGGVVAEMELPPLKCCKIHG